MVYDTVDGDGASDTLQLGSVLSLRSCGRQYGEPTGSVTFAFDGNSFVGLVVGQEIVRTLSGFEASLGFGGRFRLNAKNHCSLFLTLVECF